MTKLINKSRYFTDSELFEAVDFIASIDGGNKYKWLEKDKFSKPDDDLFLIYIPRDSIVRTDACVFYSWKHEVVSNNEYGVVRFFKFTEPDQIKNLPDHLKNKILMMIAMNEYHLDLLG
jgi:hypothetical protein